MPRRVIYAMPMNHEFALVEAKVEELSDVVDVFVLLESNYTAAGEMCTHTSHTRTHTSHTHARTAAGETCTHTSHTRTHTSHTRTHCCG